MTVDEKLKRIGDQVAVAAINAHIAAIAASQVVARGRREGWLTAADLKPILDAIESFRAELMPRLPDKERVSFEKMARLFDV